MTFTEAKTRSAQRAEGQSKRSSATQGVRCLYQALIPAKTIWLEAPTVHKVHAWCSPHKNDGTTVLQCPHLRPPSAFARLLFSHLVVWLQRPPAPHRQPHPRPPRDGRDGRSVGDGRGGEELGGNGPGFEARAAPHHQQREDPVKQEVVDRRDAREASPRVWGCWKRAPQTSTKGIIPQSHMPHAHTRHI